VTGTPAGTVAVRAAGLRVRSDGTVTAEGMAPSAGELAAFCRPVVMALAVVRRDGTVLADGCCRTSCGWASWSATSA
jgi:hypothetical protein